MISSNHSKEFLLPSPVAWGIDDKYRDDSGKWHDVGQETQSRFLEVMGANSDAPPQAALLVVRQGGEIAVPEFAELHLEDGTQLPGGNLLPADIQLGYHTHIDKTGKSSRLIVTPRRCFLPEDLRTWGWSLQLYALRSHTSWGIGDLEDLRRICKWAAGTGAGVMMINPLCAAAPVLPQQASPYYPSSRLYLNPLYLRIEELPGAREAIPELEALCNEGRALNEQPLINRDAIYKLKMRALETMWPRVRDQVNFEDHESGRARTLHTFATFCVLAEQYGANWRAWPEEFRRPDNPAVSALNAKFGDRLKFHKWLQNVLDEQLQAASSAENVMQDLPVGVAPDGADAWMWQDVFAAGVNVGSPPDMFNVNGQNWGLPPFVPHKLREAGYEPFVQTLRAALRYARGLRIDHVMGLFRLFWIPQGESAAKGTYVRYNADEMLSILALESQRAQTFIVGEDLGTVDEGVREKLAEYAVLSYRLLWFEEHPPETYPKLAVAAVSTHDLPTIAGIWSGADFDEQNQLDLKPAKENSDKMREYLKRATKLDDGANISDVIVNTHEALAKSPAVVTLASLEDGLGAEKRPNLPSAHSDKRPNWCIPLPKKLEEIENDPLVMQIATHLKR
jgi:4-alpha-glucanotransferase